MKLSNFMVIAAIVAGRKPDIDIAPFSPTRFRGA